MGKDIKLSVYVILGIIYSTAICGILGMILCKNFIIGMCTGVFGGVVLGGLIGIIVGLYKKHK